MTEKAKEGETSEKGFVRCSGQTNWPSDGRSGAEVATDACDIERDRVPGRLFVRAAWSAVRTIDWSTCGEVGVV